MTKKPLTESDSHYDHLEQMTVNELLKNINTEDQKVASAVEKSIPQVETLVSQLILRMERGGRLFYIGAGTSGRLGIVDASECPPTFGVNDDVVIGLIAGGDKAIRKAVEFAEDDTKQGYKDLEEYNIGKNDALIGIAASGRTPYVIGAIKEARKYQILTSCITCNENTTLAQECEYPIEVLVGPEFVTGSTRMKAGTAQKLVLNMITTSAMIKLGHVAGNKMIDMQLSNEKLVERGVRMLVHQLGVSESDAHQLLETHGSVRVAIKSHQK
ncbi:N-acetylmuramic acid 6-phosphate etherase [Ekhidna sp.]|uniref:N-acetylmuramic acid 6-phosphate etherase n=1 Tax=Ekhidna sp. TaxID=2608089 RepID=UPI003297DF57